MSSVDKLVNTLSWLKIFFGPFILGLLVGGCMFVFADRMIIKICGIVVFIIGIVLGVLLANYMKTTGTDGVIQQIEDSPDWDDLTKDMRDKEQGSTK